MPEFNVMSTALFTGNVDSDLRIKGPSVTGTVTVLAGGRKHTLPNNNRDIGVGFVQASPEGGTMPVPSIAVSPALYKLLALDIHVVIPGRPA